MSWKAEIQLRDLDGGQAIEVLCRKCHDARYEKVAALLKTDGLHPDSYLDEVEAHLACHRWGCKGAVTINLAGDAETSAFVGGLP